MLHKFNPKMDFEFASSADFLALNAILPERSLCGLVPHTPKKLKVVAPVPVGAGGVGGVSEMRRAHMAIIFLLECPPKSI